MWARRHRIQHDAHLRGKSWKQEPHISKRYAQEFEDAVRQRGLKAKQDAEKRKK